MRLHSQHRFFTILILACLTLVACNNASQNVPVSTAPLLTLPPTEISTLTAAVTPSPIATSWYTSTFEVSPCQFPVPSGHTPVCGMLTVPERRDKPGESRMIRLHVAVFPCEGGAACMPDPVIHLSGGPGAYGLELIPYMFDNGASAILESRDYIFFDQRGVGASEPALDCHDDETAETCQARFLAEGIDLNAYNSAASAADIQDLRAALGYEQINLLGVSYGTRLALTAMRDQASGIRSVILDSIYPPQVNLYTSWSPNAERVFNELFNTCAADPVCKTAYPDLEAVFFETVDQLNVSPVTVDVQGESGVTSLQVSGDLFLDAVYNSFYRVDVIPIIPQMIFQVREGDYTLLSTRLVIYVDGASSIGMNYSVQCYEEVPFSTWNDVLAGTQTLEHPQLAYFGTRFEYFYALCNTWVTDRPPAIENQPVFSSIPTLILSGQFDPITPPEWADLTAQTLPNSTVIHFPYTGHWVLRSGPCGWEIAQAFLSHPEQEPAAACVDRLQPFIFP